MIFPSIKLLIFIWTAATLLGCEDGLHWRDPVATKVAAGNRAFLSEDYDQAQLAYQDALLDAPEEVPEIQFNLGAVAIRNRKFDEAHGSFDRAIASGDAHLQALAHYNTGNTLFYEKKWTEAIEAYQRALELNPEDEDSKYNLELLLAKLAEEADKEQNQQQGDGEQPKASDWAKRRAARAEALAKQEHFTEAAIMMERTFETEPSAQGELGDFGQRLDQLKTIFDEMGDQVNTLPQAGDLVSRSGRAFATWKYGRTHYEEALGSVTEALTHQPNHAQGAALLKAIQDHRETQQEEQNQKGQQNIEQQQEQGEQEESETEDEKQPQPDQSDDDSAPNEEDADGVPQTPPGEMTKEEAERLLEALSNEEETDRRKQKRGRASRFRGNNW